MQSSTKIGIERLPLIWILRIEDFGADVQWSRQDLSTGSFCVTMNVKLLKYHAYSRWFGRPSWNASYLFGRACRRLKPGDIVIDAGANLGEITSALAKTGSTVHAFEPDPYTFERLRKNVGAFKNVHLYQQALADQSGTAKLYRSREFSSDPDFWSQSSSLYADKSNISKDDYTEVEQLSIVDFVRELGSPVRILKIDVEGAEVPMLESILSCGLMNKIDMIFAETHEKKIPQLAERTRTLREAIKRDWANKINLDWH
ncbi:FkbM family methyltransferase [Mesorhizobium muleiense]|uniref:FkbM family methyltransferase n=1 Tax=Mesorhizobium muleiense TaxID=1004279 RepID=UPI001F01A1BC|nr:FkbM family methyltransferase [Mesorhizobium muleiense]MCF6118151.1 FkbM family methyltransferase [Mesorhizobium muleiense]